MEKQKQPYWLLIVAGVFIITAVIVYSSSPTVRTFLKESNNDNTSTNTPIRNSYVMIMDWTNRPSASGNYQYVEGIITSRGSKTARHIEITVQALDKNDKLVALEKSYAEPPELSPGEDGIFKIMIDRMPSIAKYSVKADWRD